MEVIAQAEPVTLTGWGVAIQILAQLGAVGLLAILVYKLPELVKSLQEWRESTEKAHREERDLLRLERDANLKAYREETRYEREACQQHFDRLAEMGAQNQQVTHQVLDKISEAVRQHDALARDAIKGMSTKDGGL